MKSLKLWVFILLGLILVVFTLQNFALIEVSFLGYQFQMRRFMLIGYSILVGYLLGLVFPLGRQGKKKTPPDA